MGQLHKKQTLVVPVRRPRPGGTTAAPPPETAPVATGSPRDRSSGPDGRGDAGPKKNLGPMKLFFALVSLGLLLSTLTGLYMAYRYSRRPGLVSAILAAGVAVPLLLLLF